MTPWESTRPKDIAFKNWLERNGWNRARYVALDRYGQTDLRVESMGGLDERSFIQLWGEAAVDVTKGYGTSIGNAATATGRTIRNTAVLAVVGILGVAAVAYRQPVIQVFTSIRKTLKKGG